MNPFNDIFTCQKEFVRIKKTGCSKGRRAIRIIKYKNRGRPDPDLFGKIDFGALRSIGCDNIKVAPDVAFHHDKIISEIIHHFGNRVDAGTHFVAIGAASLMEEQDKKLAFLGQGFNFALIIVVETLFTVFALPNSRDQQQDRQKRQS